MTVDGPIDDLAPSVTLSGYRVVQEAITNIRRHAGLGRRGDDRRHSLRGSLSDHDHRRRARRGCRQHRPGVRGGRHARTCGSRRRVDQHRARVAVEAGACRWCCPRHPTAQWRLRRLHTPTTSRAPPEHHHDPRHAGRRPADGARRFPDDPRRRTRHHGGRRGGRRCRRHRDARPRATRRRADGRPHAADGRDRSLCTHLCTRRRGPHA